MTCSGSIQHAEATLSVPKNQVALADRESQRIFWVFTLCLVLVSVPIKNLAYLVPPLFLALQLLAGDRSALRVLLIVAAGLIVSSLSLMLDHLWGQPVNPAGLFLATLTYLPLFLFLGVKLEKSLDDRVFSRLINLVAWFVIVQSLIGFFQFAVSRNADAVAGTFGLFDFYFNTISIIQVYYTFNLFCMILFLMLQSHRPLVKGAIAAGLLACVLAQSGHQSIFFLACFSLFSVVQLRRLGTAIGGVALVGVVMLAIMQVYPSTWEHSINWYDKVVNNPRSPKRMVTVDSVEILSSPKNMFLGTGMGQYSSRAALITSNEYLGRKLPALASGKSFYFTQSIAPARQQFELTGEGSAISKPYFSMLSVLVEFGFVLTITFMLVFLYHLRKNLAWLLSSSPQLARIGLVCSVGLLFALLSCTIENYIEFPQAVFIPLLLYFITQARAESLS